MLRNAVNRLVAVQARNVKLECASAQMYLLDQVSFKFYTLAESIRLSIILKACTLSLDYSIYFSLLKF